MSRPEAGFLRSLDHFRGLAVLFIVAGHCFEVSGVQIDSFSERVFGNLVFGGTTLFVFISGYLFQHRFLGDFRYGRFLASKARNLLCPYLVLAIAPVAWAVVHRDPLSGGAFLPRGSGWVHEFLVPSLAYLASGRFLITYWFIPYAILQFGLAPVHRWFAHLRREWQNAILIATFALALQVQRPVDNIQPLQSLAYFLPVYLIGIVAAQRREAIFRILGGREFWLLAPILGLAGLEALQRSAFGNYHKEPWQSGPIDLILPQKVLLSFFFLVFLERYENRTSLVVGTLARSSFAIFFIHPYIIWIAELNGIRYSGHPIWPFYPFIVAAVLGLSLLLAVLIRRVSGRWSHFLIGW